MIISAALVYTWIAISKLNIRFLNFLTKFSFFNRWVKRDSYLPIGSQGLKAVAKVCD